MSNSLVYDVAVIGGGILGTASAMTLLEAKKITLVVLEAEETLAAHQTGHNSGVIHSGLYYRPGSLKARNCITGRELLYDFCAQNDIPHERCGKIVVAVGEKEIAALDKLEKRGLENGLAGIKRLGPGEIAEYEPHVSGLAGLFIPQTGIVDFSQVVEKFAGIIRTRGGEIKTGHRVTKIQRKGRVFILTTPGGEILCRNLVNCAGLQSDRVARMSRVIPGLKILPFRGEYYELEKDKEYLVKNLVYPVPDPRFPFLGVHFTRMIRGGVEAGPNAVPALKREGYGKFSFSWRDFGETLAYRGSWMMAAKYWRMGLGEIYRSWNKTAFVRTLQRLIPAIEKKDLVPGGSGVRAQAVLPGGTLLDDFSILEAEGMVHVLNAPSPAATAAISIARTIAGKAVKNFDL